MKEVPNCQAENLESLKKFLKQNPGIDFLIADLQSEELVKELNFKNLTKKKQDLLTLMKAYQRLIRIIPEKDFQIALTLLSEGIHSALQIAAMTRKDFLSRFSGMVDDKGKTAELIYQNALEKRSAILIQYMNLLQNQEPHISAAKFN